MAAIATSFVGSVLLLGEVMATGDIHYWMGNWQPPLGIEFVVDHENKYLIGDSFQQDNLAYFERANDNPIIINDMNDFTSNWLSNIKAARYKIEEIYTEDSQYNMSENPKELKQYCKEHGVMNIVRKEKELER